VMVNGCMPANIIRNIRQRKNHLESFEAFQMAFQN
jgi:hypothetical protein